MAARCGASDVSVLLKEVLGPPEGVIEDEKQNELCYSPNDSHDEICQPKHRDQNCPSLASL